MVMSEEPVDIATVVGANARRIRLAGGARLEDVAREARRFGLKWTSGKVGDLESGRVAPSLPTLIALTFALSAATTPQGESRAVFPLPELLKHDGPVQVTDRIVMRGDTLLQHVQDVQTPLRVGDMPEMREAVEAAVEQVSAVWGQLPSDPNGPHPWLVGEILAMSGELEQRIARELGLDEIRMAYESAALWGATFTAVRHERAGRAANAQARGHASRALKAELADAIAARESARNGND